MILSWTPYGLPFPKIGVRTPLKTPIAIILGTGKAMNYKFGQYIQTSEGPSEQKPNRIFGQKGAWAYPGTAQFF